MMKINQKKIFEASQNLKQHENQLKNVSDNALPLLHLKYEIKVLVSSQRQQRGLINLEGISYKHLFTT